MFKYPVSFLLLISILSIGFAQSPKKARKALSNINSYKEAENLKEKKVEWNVSPFLTPVEPLFSDDNGNLRYPLNEVIEMPFKVGGKTSITKFFRDYNDESCKVKYIFLDGSKLSKESIDSIRTIIITKYESGIDFVDLVKEYTMDGNKTGDLGWFRKGMMVKEFEDAVWSRKKDEYFKVDVDSKKWYYVVLKNHETKIVHVVEGATIRY